jgi:hypothetical protein
MSGAETFLSRWSRLKRGAAEDRDTASTEDAPPADAVDPASLPPIESITSGTDIRAFLQSGVPAELRRAALRRVWASDPAIRDFIGIAENQWDFTDPASIPGFGPLGETDTVASLMALALGTLNKAAEAVSVEEAPPAASDSQHSADDERRRHRPDMLAVAPVPEARTADAADQRDPERLRPRHGGALPR